MLVDIPKRGVILEMKRIRSYIIIMILIATIIALTTYYIIDHYKETYLEELERNLAENNVEYSNFVENKIGDLMLLVESHGRVFSSNNLVNPPKLSSLCKNINENSSSVSSLYFLYDENGSGVNASGYINVADIGMDLRQRPWYKNAVKSTSVEITSVYIDARKDKPLLTISYALRNGTQLQGVLAADVFLETLHDELQEITTWGSAYTYVLDSTGTVVLHPDKKLLGFTFANATNQQIMTLGVTKESFGNNYLRIWNDDFSKSKEGFVDYFNPDDLKVHAVYKRIPNLEWTVVSAYDLSEINNIISAYDLIGISVSFLLLIIFGAVLYYLLVWSTSRDPVTKTFNTKEMQEVIKKRQSKGGDCISLFIEQRNISSINGRRGVRGGDDVLLQYSKILQRLVRKYGVLATTKSRNFVIIFNDSDWKAAVKLTSEWAKKLDEVSLFINGNTLLIESFLGLTTLRTDNEREIEQELESVETLFAELHQTEVDNPLICYDFDKLMEEKNVEIKLKEELLKAIEEDKVVPFFQPIYDLKSGTVDKFEVLMRIQEGDKFLSPYPYISIAEKYNIIDKVDSIVISKALEYKKRNDLSDAVKLSINISGKVLNDGNFIEKIVAMIDGLNIKRSNITFEVTETQGIRNIAGLTQLVTEYRKAGFEFSIDDFGSGFSAMFYLKHIPANYVKIDGSFIKDINTSEESYHLVNAMISLAKAFNIKTIAEFVEKQEIMEMMVDMGVDYGQGYYFGKPDKVFNFQR